MDLYLFTLLLGFGGLLLMAMLGLSHGHGAVRSHHASAAGRGLRGSHGAGHHHGPALAKATLLPKHGARPSRGHSHLLGLLAPQVLFGLLLGFGAVGTLLHPLIRLPLVLIGLSAVGAWLFQRGLLSPLWNFLLGFASKPAQTLDTLVLEEGHAATNFDDSGSGLVAVDLDGQTRQILGTLCREERTQGARVRTGDRLFIQAVDGARNTCTVSRLSC